jgi:hypothetical protein
MTRRAALALIAGTSAIKPSRATPRYGVCVFWLERWNGKEWIDARKVAVQYTLGECRAYCARLGPDYRLGRFDLKVSGEISRALRL